MPTFEFEAVDADGKATVDQINAGDEREAIAHIRQMGLFPTRVALKRAQLGPCRARPQRRRKKAFVIGGVSGRGLTEFTRQLSTLTDAGIPIVQALHILEGQMGASVLRNVVGSVADEVKNDTRPPPGS
jgi:type II secretory pathway component PulF